SSSSVGGWRRSRSRRIGATSTGTSGRGSAHTDSAGCPPTRSRTGSTTNRRPAWRPPRPPALPHPPPDAGSGRAEAEVPPEPVRPRRPAAGARRDMVFLDWDQAMRLAEAQNERFPALIYLAVDSGMRWGELVGLRRGRVDLLRGKVRVTEQLTQLEDR